MATPAQLLAAKKLRKKPRPTHPGRRPPTWVCLVRQYREELGLTLRDLEKSLDDITNATIWEIEQGRETTLDNARKLAEFFGVSVETLWPKRVGK